MLYHAPASVACRNSVGNSGSGLKVHELLPKPDEGCKIERLCEQITKVRSGVHVNCLDKIGITEGLYPLLSGIHVAEPTLSGVSGLRCEGLRSGVIDLQHEGAGK